MAEAAQRRSAAARIGRGLGWLLLLAVLAVLAIIGWLWWGMERSTPVLEGEVALAGLSAPVTVTRDAQGTATVTGATRADVAQALGFLHAQDRLFRMDMLRRYAAGELAALSGSSLLGVDKVIRPHRFRARAKAMVAAMSAEERAVLDAYVAGVNQGREALRGAPFEYSILRGEPAAWTPEDTVLVVFAMYLDLQPAVPQREMDRARAAKALGAEMSAFLYPVTTELDAPIDGSQLAEPPMPTAIAPMATAPAVPGAPAMPGDVRIGEMVGSNNWAVGGALTASGAALVANDMHLGLDVPAIWYRARLVVKPAAGSAEQPMDASGVTLPGTPFLVAGSNGKVAWGYTNSYIDTSDAVIVEWVDEAAGSYRTPDGVASVAQFDEWLCARDACDTLVVRETIWGPIVGKDAFGRTIAMRWTAHNPDAIRLAPALAMERAADVPEAMAIAQRSGIPQQNFTVGDRAGNIGWTIIGRVPARFGFDGQEAVSFADGTRGWAGDLSPEATPAVLNPPGARIWTANSRVMGGEAFAKLGDGGYDSGARAGRIRDLLLAKARFAPADFLAIQLDDVATRNRFWQQLMLAELKKRPGDSELAAMVAPVEAWGERAVPSSVGYRLIDSFRREAVNGAYEAWVGKPEGDMFRKTHVPAQGEGAMRRLLRARPAALVPTGHESWDAFLDSVLEKVAEEVGVKAGGSIARYTWGETGVAGVTHPLSDAIAPLGWITNPREAAVPGDRPTVRAQAKGFGASERFAVSPGREAEGLFHMPGGQAGNPRTPYYLAGHQDWVEGKPTPFLPGPARWTLVMRPGG